MSPDVSEVLPLAPAYGGGILTPFSFNTFNNIVPQRGIIEFTKLICVLESTNP